MKRQQKEEQLAFLKEAMANVEGMVLTSLKGLNVGEVTDLRRRLRAENVQLKVIKNTLAKKAFAETELSALADDFAGETAIAWSSEDAVAPAKIVMNFKKDKPDFIVKAGFVSGERIDGDGVAQLSKLPSLDELRSKILGLLQAVPQKLVAQINAPGQQIAGVINAHVEKENA